MRKIKKETLLTGSILAIFVIMVSIHPASVSIQPASTQEYPSPPENLSVTPKDNRGGASTLYTITFDTGTEAKNVDIIEIEFAPESGIWEAQVVDVENIAENNAKSVATGGHG